MDVIGQGGRRPRRARLLVVALAVAAAACGAAGVPAAAQDGRPAWNPFLPERVAVFPVYNLSPAPAPLEAIQDALEDALIAHKVAIVKDTTLAAALDANRVRWFGGVGNRLGLALRAGSGIDGILLTTVDLYEPGEPPRVGLHARLLAVADDGVHLLWATSFSESGDATPGLFGLGLETDVAVLLRRGTEQVASGLAAYMATGVEPRKARRLDAPARFAPRSLFVAPSIPALGEKALRVAVLPFVEDTPRRAAGEILQLHFVRELLGVGGVEVIEPGEVRDILLSTRTIQEGGGLSMPQSDVIRTILEVDLVVTGTVSEYRDATGGQPPLVEFSAEGFDTKRRQVGWVGRSYETGRQGAALFGAGEVRTADELAAFAVRRMLVDLLAEARRIHRRTGGKSDAADR